MTDAQREAWLKNAELASLERMMRPRRVTYVPPKRKEADDGSKD